LSRLRSARRRECAAVDAIIGADPFVSLSLWPTGSECDVTACDSVPRRVWSAGMPPEGSTVSSRRRALSLVTVVLALAAVVAVTNGCAASASSTSTASHASRTHRRAKHKATKTRSRHGHHRSATADRTTTTVRLTTTTHVTTTQRVTTPAIATTSTAAAGCSPMTDSGNCYEPGEYCRDDDHGASGVAGDGEAITCEDNDGWRWEPS
jgi:Ni/Co efflux regulator RcnB